MAFRREISPTEKHPTSSPHATEKHDILSNNIPSDLEARDTRHKVERLCGTLLKLSKDNETLEKEVTEQHQQMVVLTQQVQSLSQELLHTQEKANQACHNLDRCYYAAACKGYGTGLAMAHLSGDIVHPTLACLHILRWPKNVVCQHLFWQRVADRDVGDNGVTLIRCGDGEVVPVWAEWSPSEDGGHYTLHIIPLPFHSK
eukprot:gb/GECH01011644.1/.p1 GENE.gb/GECH01011644.1/~~gb/GECH01011644.1/.p1  ORF type:complete len:201 (+),score=19.45 gb/GECH01011644.1/:1-603(+)